MSTISTQQLQKLAHMSCIAIAPQEQESLQRQLDDVLTYAARVKDCVHAVNSLHSQEVYTIVRSDTIQLYNAEQILQRAPNSAEHYFVVPRVIEHK